MKETASWTTMWHTLENILTHLLWGMSKAWPSSCWYTYNSVHSKDKYMMISSMIEANSKFRECKWVVVIMCFKLSLFSSHKLWRIYHKHYVFPKTFHSMLKSLEFKIFRFSFSTKIISETFYFCITLVLTIIKKKKKKESIMGVGNIWR